ncbi:MAG: hypothetical protein JSU70_04030 [Phycisphaerales bacterium]|nr:MAG: hypothetical protein JSU70_04030 [Phycisphaerales bacterium]
MCYTVMPQIGVRNDVPVAAMAFTKFESAERLFDLVKSWMKPPCDESALDISFVSDCDKSTYSVRMGPNPQQLLRRTFGEGADADYSPLTVAGFVLQTFPLSEYFQHFRQIAAGKEILVCPVRARNNMGKVDNRSFAVPMAVSQINHRAGFFKRDIRFLDKASLKSGTLDYLASEISVDGGPASGKRPEPPIPTPQEVLRQRTRQLRRFFPVTVARLPYNESFASATEGLRNRYAEWQIVQAACNLYARANWPEFGRSQNVDMLAIYQELRHHAQKATECAPLTYPYKAEELEHQIGLDIEYLHSYVCGGMGEDPESELRSKGYL